ncbi:MAG: hypothetical protein CVT49_12805 [candidate division Zixibacteria bacterium HGW-Zixibacteria-1]|nr:MAG: hypothetical protein CVT49_12805 [candidate division Zixibacteria bacterium HGW-Zixibacteria-1]
MSKVVVVRMVDRKADEALNKSDYKIMLIKGLQRLFDSPVIDKEIRTLLPGRVIGMKTNCLTHKFNSTPIPLTEALGDILIKAGFEDNNIIVWERQSRELEKAGYELNASSFGRRCFGTDSNNAGYSPDLYGHGKANSLVTRIMTDMIDSNINMPVLKDHSIAGLSGGLKNMFGAINNPNKYHADNCSPFAAHVSALTPIKTKNRLIIIDAVKVQYHMGPGYDSRYLHKYGGLIISDDPVAADRVALELLDHIRVLHNMPTLKDDSRPVNYLVEAEKIGLGIADMTRISIDVIQLDSDGNGSKGVLF